MKAKTTNQNPVVTNEQRAMASQPAKPLKVKTRVRAAGHRGKGP